MPSPSTSLASYRPDIAGAFEEFDLEMDRRGFIWNQVLPVFDVAVAGGTFPRIPIEQLLQTRDTKRAPRSGYSRADYTFEEDTFVTREHGAEEPIDDNERALYANFFDLEVVSGKRALDAVLRNAEIRVSNAVFNTTTWTGASLTTAVGTPWSTTASSTPLADVEAAVVKVWENSGLWPNTLIINRLVFRKLRNNQSIIDRIVATGAGSPAKASDVTAAMLAAAFDLDQVLIAGSPKNTANAGKSVTIAPIWSSSYAMVCRISSGSDLREPGLGRTFHWAEDGSQINGHVESYRDEKVRADVIRVRHQVGEKIIYPQAGHLLTNIFA